MNTQKDFGQLDEADIQLVINNPNENPVWTGSCEELPPTELFTLAKKVLLIIPAEAECTAEKFNSILEAVRVRIPTDSLLLFTISEKKGWKYMSIKINSNELQKLLAL